MQKTNGGRSQARTADLLLASNHGYLLVFYLFPRFSITWGVCFRSADNS
jgi:hypothetical protein